MLLLKKNILYHIFLLALSSWGGLVTYSLIYDMDALLWIRSQFQEEVPMEVPLNLEAEYSFLKSFLEDYYEIHGDIISRGSKEKKRIMIYRRFSVDLREVISDKYSRTLDYFQAQGGEQFLFIHKIIRNHKLGLYIAYLSVEQKFPKKEKRNYWIELKLKLSTLPQKKWISHWEEQVLWQKPLLLNKKTIGMAGDSISHIQLPCMATSVASVSVPSSLKMVLESRSKSFKFYSHPSFLGETQFRAQCGRRTFMINFAHTPQFLTLYQALSLSDGKLPPKALTPMEKLQRDIETQLGIEVIEESK